MHISQNPAGHHQTGRLGQYGVYYIFSLEYHCFSVERGFRQEKCSNKCISIAVQLAINVIWSLVFFGTPTFSVVWLWY